MYSCRFVPDSDEVSKQQQAELQQKKIVRRQSASPSRESDSESDVRGSRESILDPEKGTNPFLKPFPPTPGNTSENVLPIPAYEKFSPSYEMATTIAVSRKIDVSHGLRANG